MARRLLKIVAILVVVLGLLAAVVLLAHAKADTEAGYAVLKLIAGESGGPAEGAMMVGPMRPGQGMSGHSCGGGGSCSMGADDSCSSGSSCAATADDEQATEAAGEPTADDPVTEG